MKLNRSAASNSGFTVFSQLENYAEPSLFFVFMSLHVTSQKSFLYVSTKWQFNAKNVRFVESCRCMHLIHSTEISGSQCGDYENSLSRIFGKNFVKVTVLLNKLLKSWFDEIFFWWDWERIPVISTQCGFYCHSNFTWNHFWLSWRSQNGHFDFLLLQRRTLNFCKFLTSSSVKLPI